jgi:hypothetical protein
MRLEHVPATHVDFAWNDGAHFLAKACDASGGEITGDQLKMIIARGERTLLRMTDDKNTAGWGVVRIDQLPNFRVLMVTDLVAPKVGFERFWIELVKLAKALGCSRIRWAAKEAQERLYKMKIKDSKNVYQIMEVEL